MQLAKGEQFLNLMLLPVPLVAEAAASDAFHLLLLLLLQKYKHYYSCKPCLMTEIPRLW